MREMQEWDLLYCNSFLNALIVLGSSSSWRLQVIQLIVLDIPKNLLLKGKVTLLFEREIKKLLMKRDESSPYGRKKIMSNAPKIT